MHHIRLTLVFGIFASTAIPVHAAQVCEAEIRAIEEAVKAGGVPEYQHFRERGANIRRSALDAIESYPKNAYLCSETTTIQEIVAKSEATVRDRETRLRNREQEGEKGAHRGSIESYKKSLYDARANLAVAKLHLCAQEAHNAKVCKESGKR